MITATVAQLALLIALGNPFIAKAELTWYDPALGGINCFVDCEFAGFRVPVESSYGHVTACPLEFPRGTKFIISGSGPHYDTGHSAGLADGIWTCRDWGYKVRIGYDSFLLDLMSRTPLQREKLWVTVIPPQVVKQVVVKCHNIGAYDTEWGKLGAYDMEWSC